MVEREIEVEVERIETETIAFCDSCGEPIDDRTRLVERPHYDTTVRGDGDTEFIAVPKDAASYDVCAGCKANLDETAETMAAGLGKHDAGSGRGGLMAALWDDYGPVGMVFALAFASSVLVVDWFIDHPRVTAVLYALVVAFMVGSWVGVV